ncbi:MAG: family transporter [Rhizobiaceae bacterium]|jgi:predicted PurR-regulated permease PerM|nr:family transporter [Rhizobiaceae bacterium]MCD6071242.1 family transporter [Microvirga sp.]
MRSIEDQTFLWLLVATSAAFALVVWPFYGAVLWAIVGAIVFSPLHRQLFRATGQRAGLTAALSVLIIISIVIVPVMLIASSLALQATALYESIDTGKLNVGQHLRDAGNVLPTWMKDLLASFGLTSLDAVRERLSAIFSQFLQALVARAVTVGQSTLDFIVSMGVMLYLLFFLFRDGSSLTQRIRSAVPLRAGQRDALLEKFAVVVRAIVKGTVLVAALQGALGGLIFWLMAIPAPVLWGVMMGFMSLLPAIGSSLVWLPVALYLIATGSVTKGLVLIAFGTLVISLVDNLLRPALVGKSTRIPDYLVLITTLGGLSLFGLNGFVIGPAIAAMFIAVWDIFVLSRHELNRAAGASDPAPGDETGVRDPDAAAGQ